MKNWLITVVNENGKQHFTIVASTRNEAHNTARRLGYLLEGKEPIKFEYITIEIEEI